MDNSVTEETKVYFSRKKALKSIIILVLLICLGVFLLFNADRLAGGKSVLMNVYAVFCLLFPVGPLIKQYYRLQDATPQLILDAKGIQIIFHSNSSFMPDKVSTKYYTWSEIGGEYTDEERVGRSKVSYLKFDNPEGDVKFSIGSLDIDKDYLNELLVYYRELSGKKYQYYS